MTATALIQHDSAILAAYEVVRANRVWCYGFDDTQASPPEPEASQRDEAQCAAENLIMQLHAATIAGVIARLTLLVPGLDNSRWVDSTLMRDGIAGLLPRQDELDGYAGQVLLAIMDLQAIADQSKEACNG